MIYYSGMENANQLSIFILQDIFNIFLESPIWIRFFLQTLSKIFENTMRFMKVRNHLWVVEKVHSMYTFVKMCLTLSYHIPLSCLHLSPKPKLKSEHLTRKDIPCWPSQKLTRCLWYKITNKYLICDKDVPLDW